MIKDKRVRGRRGTARPGRKPDALNSLQAEEAAQVLRQLLSAHPDLRTEAEEIAGALPRAVSFEDIATAVEDAVLQLDADTLYGRSGGHSWGYVEPTEAAWEMLEEAIEPFRADMKRYLDLGLESQALEVCKGIVLGLYRVRDAENDEFLGWAEDFPAEAAGEAVEYWLSGGEPRAAGKRRRRTGRLFPADFLEQHVPEWREMLERVARKEGG